MADTAELERNLEQLRQQQEGLQGLIQLNPDNGELCELLKSITEARQLTESGLMALKQSAMLTSLDELTAPPPEPEMPLRPPSPPPVLPPVGERVLALYSADKRYYAATVDAVFPPRALRLRWLFATTPLPAFHLSAERVRPFDGVDLRSLRAGAECVALRPGAVAWSWAKVLQRGGGGGGGGIDDAAATETILVEFAEAIPLACEGAAAKDLYETGGQCSLPASHVAPGEYAIEPPDEASEEDGEGSCSGDEELEAEAEGEEGEGGAPSAGDGWVGARARGTVGDFENYTRGVGSRLMRAMGWAEGQGLGRSLDGPARCLAVERLPQHRLSLDSVAAHRARREERRAAGTLNDGGEASGVKRGGRNRNRGDAGRWRRARRQAGLDPVERQQVERALARGPEPPDVFDFLNNQRVAGGRPPSEHERREHQAKQAVRDSKKAAPTLRRRLLQARERKRTLQDEEAQLRERSARLGRAAGGGGGSGGGAGSAGGPTSSMGQQLLAQDQGRLRQIATQVATLEGEERQLERLLGEKAENKKMFKF